MKYELTFRPLKESDYSTIAKWWEWWKWPVLPKESLPNNGTGGFMVEKDGILIVSVFLFVCNNATHSWGWMEWLVSNPNYRQKDRKKAIELLISKTEEESKKIGIKYLVTIGRNKHLINTHEKLGWHVDRKPSYEITKTI